MIRIFTRRAAAAILNLRAYIRRLLLRHDRTAGWYDELALRLRQQSLLLRLRCTGRISGTEIRVKQLEIR